jgi:WD40 repeat protein
MKEFLFETKFKHTMNYKLAWNSNFDLAICLSNGYLITWNLLQYLKTKERTQTFLAKNDYLFYVPVHRAENLQVKWLKRPDSSEFILFICSSDGKLSMLDPRDPYQPLLIHNSHSVVPDFSISEKYNTLTTINQEREVIMMHIGNFPSLPFDDDPNSRNKNWIEHMSDAIITCVDSSPFFHFDLMTSADGTVRVLNRNQLPARMKTLTKPLFKIDIIHNELVFLENVAYGGKKNGSTEIMFSLKVCVTEARWNVNKYSKEFIASGGLGWARIDDVFKYN